MDADATEQQAPTPENRRPAAGSICFLLFFHAMEPNTYHVLADWDAEANVWVATSDDVPGLATEAATIEVLTTRLRTMIPELLEANGLLPENVPSDRIAFELTSRRQELVTLAS